LARNNRNYDAKHFKDLFALEAGNFWFEARNDIILWAIRRFFQKPARVLEIGVGTGFVARAIREDLPSASLAASDIHTEGLAFAAQRVGDSVELLQMDGTRIPFQSEFDLIGMFDVLEHIRDDEKVLSEVREALVPGGGLIISVPQHMFLWGPADKQACHERRYASDELAKKVRTAQFDVVYKTSFVALLLPVLYAARIGTRISGAYSLEQELTLPAAINAALRWILACEFRLIRSGFRLPLGGSQLLVAVKRV
jgi:SAM-dependent methyltransferase